MKNARAIVVTMLCGMLAGCSNAKERPPKTLAAVRAHQAADSTVTIPRILDERQRLHVLSRLTFGATASSLRELEVLGFERWLEEQLSDTPPSSPTLAKALEPYQSAIGTPREVALRYQYDEPHERVGQEKRDNASSFQLLLDNIDKRRLLRDYQMVMLSRHMLNPKQLKEVMVDFWTNHFNVYAPRRRMALFVPDYIDSAIRPHALGRFEDLLLATARHPAMLQYLDNIQSRRPIKSKGLNENYARELLELHTLGVNAGYSQDDVRSAAHVLTGWSMETVAEGGLDFTFREDWHSPGPQRVFGQTFSAEGVRQGEDMLRWLASHPATAKHVAMKLCMRFVADIPPPGCVETASTAFLSSGGDIAWVLKSIVAHPTFLDPENTGNQLKSPLDFAMSAARMLGALPDGSTVLPRRMAVLGEGPLLEPLPTGYSKRTDAWGSTDNLMQRFRFATMIATRRAGLILPSIELLPSGTSKDVLLDRLEDQLPFLRTYPHAAKELLDALVEIEPPKQRQVLAISLLLSSAEFQKR